MDHHPRPRVKYKGQVRTNKDATIQRWRTYPLLCSSTPGQQHSGAFSHSLPECYRCLHQMVEWKTSSTCHCTPGPMVPHSKPSTAPQTVSTKVAPTSSRPPSSVPYTILQDGFHQACSSPRPTVQSQASSR